MWKSIRENYVPTQPRANPAALNRQFETLINEATPETILLSPDTDLTRGVGHFIASQMQFLVEAEEAGLSIFNHRIRKANFEESVLNSILLYVPHSLSHRLDSPRYSIVPRDVRRVIDFMHASLDQPLRLSDLVDVAQIPGRTLNSHFREFTGYSPMAAS